MGKILIVEDDIIYSNLLVRRLSKFFEVEVASTLTQAIIAFGIRAFSAVLLDMGLPDAGADDAVARMKREYPNCAIVVLSGHEDPARIKKCIADSASSYLIKGRDDQSPETLATAIRSAMSNNATSQKVERVRRELENGFDI